MFRRVDTDEELEGFSYRSSSGGIDKVICGANSLSVGVQTLDMGEVQEISVWVEDIPKLIKALQAAYDFKRSEKDGYK